MRLYLRAISFFTRDRGLIGALLFLVAISVTIGLLQAWPLAVLVDAVLTLNPKRDFIHRIFLAPFPDNKLAQVIGVTAIGLLLKVAQDTITLARNMLNNRIKYNGTTRARSALFAKLQQLDASYHRSRPQGDSIFRLSSDAWGLFGVLDACIAALISAVTLTAMVWIMLSRNVWLTVYALSITPLMIAANVYFGRTIRRRATVSRSLDSQLTTSMQRWLSSTSLVQAFNRQRSAADDFDRANDRAIEGFWNLNWQEQLYPWVVNLIYSIGGAVVFGYGGYLVYRDNFLHPTPHGVMCGDLTVFMAYLGSLWDPLRCLTGFFANVQGQAAAAERVLDVLDRRCAVVDPLDPVDLPADQRALRLKDVAFEYEPGAPVLRGIDVTIDPGDLVAFIGPSGAGKSTLLALLARSFDPTRGAITLDGVDLRNVRVADVRAHLSIVAQDTVLLAMTIEQNIAFSRPTATRRQIRDAARLAGAVDFIEELPDRYDTQLQDGGQNLSGGQRQRIAIARALLSEAPILILDEPTSALDPQHERQLMSTLRNLRRFRTIVLVTHRVQTLADCDQIFVLADGHIVQRGTHEALLSNDGPYRDMFNGSATMLSEDISSDSVATAA